MTFLARLRRLLGRARQDSATDESLEQSRARYERIVEIAADAIISVDARERIVLFNAGAESIFGYDRTEVLGQPLDILLPERFRKVHSAHLASFANSPEVARRMGERREISGVRSDGTEFPAEASISRVDSPTGPVFTVVLRDITDRKRAEETQRFLADASAVLARSLEYEDTLAGLGRVAVTRLADWCVIDVVEHDELRRIHVAHRDPELDVAAQRLMAYPPTPSGPHPARTVLETGEPELIAPVPDAFLRAVATNDEHLAVLQALGVASILVIPLVARGRTLGSLALVAADPARAFSSEDRVLAEELARRAALAVDNARLYREARAAVAARDEVLSVVSHDLGNSLSAIRVAGRVMARQLDAGDEDAARGHLEGVRAAALQMERLIKDLVEIRRIEAGQLRLVRQPETVAELVRAALGAARTVAEEQEIELRSILDERLPPSISVDADRIQQIFSNLIGNALKFTPRGGSVTVEAAPGSDEVVFDVRDTGPGIPADQLPHVFDRFWQAQAQGSHGVGLGLAIAKGLAEAHGGRVGVESEPGTGTRFWFAIPTR